MGHQLIRDLQPQPRRRDPIVHEVGQVRGTSDNSISLPGAEEGHQSFLVEVPGGIARIRDGLNCFNVIWADVAFGDAECLVEELPHSLPQRVVVSVLNGPPSSLISVQAGKRVTIN